MEKIEECRFEALDDDGHRYTIIQFITMIDAPAGMDQSFARPLKGTRSWAVAENSMPAFHVDDDTWQTDKGRLQKTGRPQ